MLRAHKCDVRAGCVCNAYAIHRQQAYTHAHTWIGRNRARAQRALQPLHARGKQSLVPLLATPLAQALEQKWVVWEISLVIRIASEIWLGHVLELRLAIQLVPVLVLVLAIWSAVVLAVPVGLLGLGRNISLVRPVMASRIWVRSWTRSGIGTSIGVAPISNDINL